jgi:ABC-type transport system involved in cytochrome bd biosynthesis fused ATPase/permease subunit
VAEGERFVAGDLEENVVALSLDPVETEALTALYESCSLAEVSEALGDRVIDEVGEPLSSLHRLLVLVARVIPSTYRVLVVHDPMPWVNAVRREIWRSAVVRASVGRTAVWITADRQLASRASVVMELRQGALRPLEDAISEGGGPPA